MVRPFGKLRTHHQRILLDFAIALFMYSERFQGNREWRVCYTGGNLLPICFEGCANGY